MAVPFNPVIIGADIISSATDCAGSVINAVQGQETAHNLGYNCSQELIEVATIFTKTRIRPGKPHTPTITDDIIDAPQSTGGLVDDAVRAGDAGSFGSLQRLSSVVGDALDLHHMPQAAAGYTTRAQGGALVMPQAEHMLTRTYGFRGAQALKADAGLSFRQVLARDIWDVRSIAGTRYNQGLRDLTGYYHTNFPELMTRGTGP